MYAKSKAGRRPYRMAARAEAAAATGERLLQAAWGDFATRPYEEVALADIAAAAGVSAQTLHNRFGSKEELFVAAFARWGEGEIARREDFAPGDTAAAIAALFDHYEAHGAAILRLLSQEERIAAVAGMIAAGRAYHRAWVERAFAPQLAGLRGGARRRALAALVLATDVLAWKVLRRDEALSRRDAEAVAAAMVAPAAAEGGGR